VKAESEDPSCMSILCGVDDLIDAALGLKREGSDPRYGTLSGCREAVALSPERTSDLIEAIRTQIQLNWDKATRHSESRQNWRFTKNKGIDPENPSREVQCERAIVNLSEAEWPDAKNWANQVPVASGLTGSKRDKKRCIDLVHKHANGEYDFIELKIDADNPLYAAMEIFKYGILYIFYREGECLAKYRYVHENENMLAARAIHLMVAAPAVYYENACPQRDGTKVDLSWLEPSLNGGLAQYLKKSGYAFTMDFQFRNCEDPPFPPKALCQKPPCD
jgi:hypothetical protein